MLNIIMFYDDRGRWWQPGNYLTKVIDSSSDIRIYNHGVIPEDIGVLNVLPQLETKIDFVLVVDSGCTQHKLHHHTEQIREAGTKTAIWLSDTHLGWEDRKRWIQEFRYDYVFVAQKDAVDKVKTECRYSDDQVVWLPHAVDIDIFKPNDNFTKRYNAVSVGFMNGNRERLFPIIEDTIGNFVHKSTIWAWSVSKAYQEGHIGINIPVLNDPLNMRCFEIGACRIPQVIAYPKDDPNGLFDLFENGKDLLAFEIDDFVLLKDHLVRLLTNPDYGRNIAESMYEKVITQHTYKHRFNSILSKMGFEELT